MKKGLIVFLFLILFLIPGVDAAIIYASSPARDDVVAAINVAEDGDIVQIPEGESYWSVGITLPTDRTLNIQGAGVGATIINTPLATSSLFSMSYRGHRIGNIETENGQITVYGCQGFRIHNMKFSRFEGTAGYRSIYVSMYTTMFPDYIPWGVIDNNTFWNCKADVSPLPMLTDSNLQHQLWAMDALLGSYENVIYIENNVYARDRSGNCVDSNYGGRYVYRYNQITNSYAECHSIQGYNRASRTWEIYNNSFTAGSNNAWTAMYLRGGTGVVYNNIIIGYSNAVILNNVRDDFNRDQSGQCDGTSGWDQNTPGEAGWACRDQIGRGKDNTLWWWDTGTGTGGVYDQASDPAYFWGNTWNGNPVTYVNTNHYPSDPPHIVENRDFFMAQKSDYIPYIYPHPLTIAPFRTNICGEGEITEECWCEGMKTIGYCYNGYYSTEEGEPPADTTPPIRSSGSPSGNLSTGTTSTTISLNTNEVATCRYSTTAGISYNSMVNTFSTTGSTTHSQLITGLTNGNSYNYYVRCIDSYGNANTNDYLISFSVSPSPEIVTLQDMLGAYQQYKRNEVSLIYFLDKLRRWIVFW